MNKIEFRNTLRNDRISHGISQEKLACAVGITRQYVNEIETGKANPSQRLKRKLTKYMEGCSYGRCHFLMH
ncbi:MAG: helix-turn-helix transcriptional regulator [Lachnospiraceae bacterium]|nr:helix-turn-helix transcriptional regulator [Lachnospiraceae bacterium]